LSYLALNPFLDQGDQKLLGTLILRALCARKINVPNSFSDRAESNDSMLSSFVKKNL
jgi:hypothetical protein